MWLENCNGQNKSVFFSALLTYVNSPFCYTSTITLNYHHVSGHTYMAAGGLHSKIEQVIRDQGNVEDFRDFEECCRKASKRMNFVKLEYSDFMKLENKFKVVNRKKKCE